NVCEQLYSFDCVLRLQDEDATEGKARRRVLRIQIEGAARSEFRFGKAMERNQRNGQIVVGGFEIWTKIDGLLQFPHRLIVFAKIDVDGAEVVVRFDESGCDLGGFPKVVGGGAKITGIDSLH